MATGIGIYTKTLPALQNGQQVAPQVDQRGRLIVSSGDDSVIYTTNVDLDTSGGVVPTWKAHRYVYDENSNMMTDTVASGDATWVRSYGGYGPGGPTSDSGWIKQ